MELLYNSLKIVVCFHDHPNTKLKQYLISNKDVLIPILGGSSTNLIKEDSWIKENCLFDDIGDNISNLNKNINEMTVVYWAWKHYDKIGNPDYIGLNHYRRFFVLDDVKNFINNDNVDIICKNEEKFDITLHNQYIKCHIQDDLLTLYHYLKTKYNNENDWYNVFVNAMNSKSFIGNNVFIMRRELFFEYCNFIFPILFDIIPLINISNRDDYQKRAVGFISERLTYTFIFNKMKTHNVRKLPIIFEK